MHLLQPYLLHSKLTMWSHIGKTKHGLGDWFTEHLRSVCNWHFNYLPIPTVTSPPSAFSIAIVRPNWNYNLSYSASIAYSPMMWTINSPILGNPLPRVPFPIPINPSWMARHMPPSSLPWTSTLDKISTYLLQEHDPTNNNEAMAHLSYPLYRLVPYAHRQQFIFCTVF